MQLGIQLYTVRDIIDDDPVGTLEALAKMGYRGVEFAWQYGGLSPLALSRLLRRLNLSACGLHVGLNQILNRGSEAYAYAYALGCRYISTSLQGAVAKDWETTVAQVAKAAEIARAKGLIFTYHNHAQEMQKIHGFRALDYLYARTDPLTIKAEIDVFWVRKGGVEPVSYLSRYAGRVRQVHLKDMRADDMSFTELGTGCMPLRELFRAARHAGAAWMIYEQDQCAGSPLDSARISIENLRALGLA